MTDERFYKILDKYERLDELGDTHIPERFSMSVAKEILKYDKKDFNECIADAILMWQGSENIPKKIINYFVKKCPNAITVQEVIMEHWKDLENKN